jgi:dihydroorotate dehydrogenase
MPKFDLSFATPILNAAGSLGFAPTAHGPLDIGQLGAFVTNPISYRGRSPASGRGIRSFPGGFWLHSGYPNPGFQKVLRACGPRWQRSPVPVIVHLLAPEPGREGLAQLARMARLLEGQEGVMAVELGLPPSVNRTGAAALVEAAASELPLILRLPLDRAALFSPQHAGGEWERRLEQSVAALSLGPPRGALPQSGSRLLSPGRLFGPALLPQTLAAVHMLASSGLVVIGAGGIYAPQDVQAVLAAGAAAVQLDAVLWRPGVDLAAFRRAAAGTEPARKME